MTRCILLICACCMLMTARAQQTKPLEKMPPDLEKALALSALPAHLRTAATVYLLDPAKGYYVAQQGTNGFVCFVDRTDWEWGEFRSDVFAPMAYNAEGARTIVRVYQDVAAMRASGKFTARQIKDLVIERIHKGIYTAPARSGISYMLAPVMRVYTGVPGDNTVMTMSMPHYMVYAPYATASDVGTLPNSWPFLANPGNTVLGAGKGPFGFIIMPANEAETAKIRAAGKELVTRLEHYSPYFKVDAGMH